MALLRPVANAEGNRYGWNFWCPGCEAVHFVTTGWAFDGNEQAPTFSPSVLVTWDEGAARTPRRCHSFVRAGHIEFLVDCTHPLAGRTVPMVDYDAARAAWAAQGG